MITSVYIEHDRGSVAAAGTLTLDSNSQALIMATTG